jgi:hypothetical protein
LKGDIIVKRGMDDLVMRQGKEMRDWKREEMGRRRS